MGKGSRARASRKADRRGRDAPPSGGAALGIGVGRRAPTGPKAPPAGRDGVVGRVRDQDVVWRPAARVTDALARLEELAAARAGARRWWRPSTTRSRSRSRTSGSTGPAGRRSGGRWGSVGRAPVSASAMRAVPTETARTLVVHSLSLIHISEPTR